MHESPAVAGNVPGILCVVQSRTGTACEFFVNQCKRKAAVMFL